eukprot:scaffold26543_cov101-Isochrysis_galbana.AAC.5
MQPLQDGGEDGLGRLGNLRRQRGEHAGNRHLQLAEGRDGAAPQVVGVGAHDVVQQLHVCEEHQRRLGCEGAQEGGYVLGRGRVGAHVGRRERRHVAHHRGHQPRRLVLLQQMAHQIGQDHRQVLMRHHQ